MWTKKIFAPWQDSKPSTFWFSPLYTSNTKPAELIRLYNYVDLFRKIYYTCSMCGENKTATKPPSPHNPQTLFTTHQRDKTNKRPDEHRNWHTTMNNGKHCPIPNPSMTPTKQQQQQGPCPLLLPPPNHLPPSHTLSPPWSCLLNDDDKQW